MNILGIDHVVMTVPGVAATISFCERVLGLTHVAFDEDHHPLHCGSQKINLHPAGREYEPHASRPLTWSADLGFVSSGKIDEVVEQSRTAGIAIEHDPVQQIGATGQMMSVYFSDLDGNLIEAAWLPVSGCQCRKMSAISALNRFKVKSARRSGSMNRRVNKTVVGNADRLYAYAIRTCILNLIAQIALGTPVAAQTRDNSRPAQIPRQIQTAPDLSAPPVAAVNNAGYLCSAVKRSQEERCPTQTALNVLAMVDTKEFKA